ncbi:MAG: putative aminopeptidase [Idiomarinaceae bacterium HL-53]|nr:MAG: putative aminopeptidase [Idiomarinaceae bacterium HL-53]CUS48370.1 Peptidase family M28 [Idiomarinaceae bacterium HL-53]
MSIHGKKIIYGALILLALALFGWFSWNAYIDHLTAKETARVNLLIERAQPGPLTSRLNHDQLLTDITWLAHEERSGRAPGTEGGLAARAYIQERFKQLGLEPGGEDGYLHRFEIPKTTDAANVIARVEGSQPSLRTIVITAHYDHLGEHEGRIYPGADDNASGTAALLAIAAYLKENQPRHTVLLAALDAEEGGLRGARALFSTNFLEPKNIAFNLNLDMLSRDTDNLLFAVGTYHDPWLVPLVRRAQMYSAVKLIPAYDRPRHVAGDTPDWTTASDHGPFHEQGIPFIYLGVPDHPDYHQPSDTADKVDVDFYRASAEAALNVFVMVDRVLAEKE